MSFEERSPTDEGGMESPKAPLRRDPLKPLHPDPYVDGFLRLVAEVLRQAQEEERSREGGAEHSRPDDGATFSASLPQSEEGGVDTLRRKRQRVQQMVIEDLMPYEEGKQRIQALDAEIAAAEAGGGPPG